MKNTNKNISKKDMQKLKEWKSVSNKILKSLEVPESKTHNIFLLSDYAPIKKAM